MLLLSGKARRYVETAVSALGDERQKSTWCAWSAGHPDIRSQEDLADETMPPDVVHVAVTALDHVVADMDRRKRSMPAPDEEEADLDNGIMYVASIRRLLTEDGAR